MDIVSLNVLLGDSQDPDNLGNQMLILQMTAIDPETREVRRRTTTAEVGTDVSPRDLVADVKEGLTNLWISLEEDLA